MFVVFNRWHQFLELLKFLLFLNIVRHDHMIIWPSSSIMNCNYMSMSFRWNSLIDFMAFCLSNCINGVKFSKILSFLNFVYILVATGGKYFAFKSIMVAVNSGTEHRGENGHVTTGVSSLFVVGLCSEKPQCRNAIPRLVRKQFETKLKTPVY